MRTFISTPLFVAVLLVLCTLAAAGGNTQLVSNLSLGNDNSTADLTRDGDWAYVARRSKGVDVVDISDPGAPVVRATIDPDPNGTVDIKDVKVLGDYLYIADESGVADTIEGNFVGLYIYDVTTPASPVKAGALVWGGGAWWHLGGKVHNLAVAEIAGTPYVFLASDITAAVEIFDVTDPAAPVFQSTIQRPTLGAQAHDMTIVGTTCYVAWMRGGFGIYDVSTPGSPVIEAEEPYTGPAVINGGVFSVAPTTDGLHLLTTEYASPSGLRIFDISNLLSITQAGYWALGTGASINNVMVAGDFAFISHLEDGLQILDVSDPTTPVVRGCFDPDTGTPTGAFDGAWGVYADGGDVLLSHRTDGLYVIAWEDEVTVTKADWRRKKKQLVVRAESTFSPDAVLTVDGFGTMTYNSRKDRYELKVKPVTANPGTVTVRSSLGGVATRVVRVR